MSRAPNPFVRPSVAPENPEVLELKDFLPAGSQERQANAQDATPMQPVLPVVLPKPLPPPEMEEKKIRVSVKLTMAEHWDLKRRVAGSNMGVDEYLRTLLFPAVQNGTP
jgi:hypothetical protein